MTPAFEVLVDGSQDATRAIAERLRTLSVSDSVGLSADAARIEIEDDGRLELPRRGAVLAIKMGLQGGLRDMGTFAVDGLRVGSAPDRMEIRATAVDLRGPLKQRRTRSWDGATLGDVIGDTASSAGLRASVEPALARIRVAHVDQAGESGLQLLTRLARRHDFGWRVWDGRLSAIPLSGGTGASGQRAETVEIRPPAREWRLRISDRPLYRSVVARWRDVDAAEAMTVTAGSGEPAYELRWELESEAEASAAAKARLVSLRREAEALDVTTGIPDVRLRALAPLDVRGFRKGVDGSWTCSRAIHLIADKGYSTAVEAYRSVT